MNEKLELLSMAKTFKVKKNEYNPGYEVRHRNASLCADILDNTLEIKYYVSGVYNSGIDYAEIDMDALMELKKFCEMMIK